MYSILSLINKNRLLSLCLVVTNVVFAQNSNKTIVDASCIAKVVISASSNLNCDVTSVFLDGSASSSSANITYNWTTVDGNIFFDQNKIAIAGQAGTYTLTVVDLVTGCSDSTSVLVTSDMINPVAYFVVDTNYCDNSENSGGNLISLEHYTSEIIKNQKDVVVTYHETEADAIENINSIPTEYIKTTKSIQEIFARITNTRGCYDITTFRLIASPSPLINSPITYELCDINNTGDEIEIFDLTSKVDEIINNELNLFISFYKSKDDLHNRINNITNLKSYVNTVLGGGVETVYVNVENRSTACSIIGILDLRVNINASNECNLSSPEFDFESQFSLFPNPVIDVLHIQSKGDSVIDSVAIYNYMGQLVLTTKPTAAGVDVSGLSKGVYVLKATTNNGTTVTKFVKE